MRYSGQMQIWLRKPPDLDVTADPPVYLLLDAVLSRRRVDVRELSAWCDTTNGVM
jgi:hypothetical protein